MKNLPEEEAFRILEKRLEKYQELPDEQMWDAIVAKTPITNVGRAVWINHVATVTAGFMLFYILLMNHAVENIKRADGDGSRVKTGIVAAPPITNPKESNASVTAATQSGDSETNVSVHTNLETTHTNNIVLRGPQGNTASANQSDDDGKSRPMEETVTERDADPSILAGSSPLQKVVLAGSPRVELDHDSVHIGKNKTDSTARPLIKVVVENTIIKKYRTSSLALYGMLKPLMTYQTVRPGGNDNIQVTHFGNPGIISLNRGGLALEGGIQNKITRRLGYLAGLFLYYQNQELNYSAQSDQTTTIGSDGHQTTIGEGLGNYTIRYHMFNVGAQAGLMYLLQPGRVSHKIGATVSMQHGMLSSGKDDAYKNSGSDYYGYQLLYRIEFTYNNRTRLFIQPSYGRTFSQPENLSAPFTLKQYQAGIGFGLVYYLRPSIDPVRSNTPGVKGFY